jgi:hypothetical protein
VAVDRVDAEDSESEERPVPDRPPPDRPGADDQPSRADSRKAADEAGDERPAATEDRDEDGDEDEAPKGGLTRRTPGTDTDAEVEEDADVPRHRPAAGREAPERPRPETDDTGLRSSAEQRTGEAPFWTSSGEEGANLTDGGDRPDTAADRPRYPEVTDRSDYTFAEREYAFAGISPEQAWDMQERRAPLGMEPDQWHACVGELRDALAADDIVDADVRLKGSAARCSSEHPKKWFPQSEEDLRARVGDHYRNAPADERTRRMNNSAATYRGAGFAEDRAKPAAPFFDGMYRLDATNESSGYDFQVASDGLAGRFQQLEREDPATGWRSAHGGHYKHRHLERVAPALHEWAGRWDGVLGRDVTIATFDRRGPSTGLHDSDWKVIEPEERTDP